MSGPKKRKGDPQVVPSRRFHSRPDYSQVLERVFREVVVESDELELQRSTVPALVAELSTLDLNQRKLLVSNSPRYRSWPLAEALLQECQRCWSEDPLEGEQFAETALEVADCLTANGFRGALLHDLKAEIWSYIGNCRRIRSRLNEAKEAFSRGEQHLLRGSGDPNERARFLDLESSLLRAQRRFGEAAAALTQAIEIYRQSGNLHSEGRALMKQAKLLADAGAAEDAVPLLKRAANLIDPQREPRLGFLLKLNLAWHLVESGHAREGRALLGEIRDAVRRLGSRHDRLRVLWLEGAVRKELGQFELAEEALGQVREGFISAQIPYDVALVSLDLAALYLEAGQTNRVRKTAIETLQIFASIGVARELLVAWQLFKEAADRDTVTTSLVKQLSARIRGSRSGSIDSPALP